MYIYSLGLQTLTTAEAFFARHCPLTGRYLEPWHGQTRTRVARELTGYYRERNDKLSSTLIKI
jgi:hypothetical protein